MELPRVWQLWPLVGGGPLRFGMTYDEVAAIIGPADHAPHGGTPGSPSRGWWARGALSLDFSPRLEFIEVSGDGPLRALLLDIDVFATPAEAVAAELECRGHELGVDAPARGRSYVYPELQASFWRPDLREDAARAFATVAVGAPGYYG